MLSISEIKIGRLVQINGEPYVVVRADHHKMGRGGAVLKTKLKNLINGNVLEKTFQGNEKAEAAETEIKRTNFMYKNDSQAFFMDNENYEQFEISLDQIGAKQKYLKEGADVDALYFSGQPVSIQLPIKMEFKVVSSPPGVRGNTAGSVTKQVEIETGELISAPLFIKAGDIIRINTDTGEYVERA